MSVIIDGYNFMNIVGIIGRGVGPGSLERARLAMLNLLAESLDPKDIAGTTVVFDASDSPPGLPCTVEHRGLTVRFASQYPDADSLIEELIGQSSAPRRLTVVSNDHRIQRAARRRRATAMDCEVWYTGVLARRHRRVHRQTAGLSARPPVPLLEEDVAYWMRQFGGEAALEDLLRGSARNKPPPTKHDQLSPDDLYNPFPPGYGEDVEP